MSLVARSAFAARTAVRTGRQQVRNMSGHGNPEEIYQSKELWFKTSIIALAFVIVPFTAFTVYKEATHEHHERHEYSHMKRRTKAFPWKESDCDLFDLHCKHAQHH